MFYKPAEFDASPPDAESVHSVQSLLADGEIFRKNIATKSGTNAISAALTVLPRDETSADVKLISDLEKLHTGHGVQIPDGSDALVLGLAMMKVTMMKMMVCWFFAWQRRMEEIMTPS